MRIKAAVLTEMGVAGPYAVSRPLSVEEVELSPPGRGEVLVRIAAAGLCHSDLSTLNGTRPWPVPIVLGHEASGVVEEVGPDVYDLVPGDHVVFAFVPACGHCLHCATARPALCENGLKANRSGGLLTGSHRLERPGKGRLNHHLGVAAFAEYSVAARPSLVKIDPDFPIEKAALFGCAVLTGVGAAVNTAKLEPGTDVAVFGMGGVGLCAVMGAKLAGARQIVAVDVLPAKLEMAKRCGATDVVDASQCDAVEAVRELTKGGASCVFESVGHEDALAKAYLATRRGGTTISIGLPHPSKMLSIPASSLVAEEKTLKGSYMGSAVPARDIPRFIDLYKQGLLPVDLLLTRTIRLDEINEAFDALDKGEVIRQLLVFPN